MNFFQKKSQQTAKNDDISNNGRLLTFQVRAYDGAGLIGEGSHQRAVVDKARFEAKAAAKRE
ncbi:MAG: hypothetical protein UIB39_04330 [Lachnospiraceae bacterium]|nr:hypothetical protein [Lachnospiraceae bacterium]